MEEKRHPGAVQLLNYSQDLDIEGSLRAHIEGCDHCQRMVADLRREQESLSAQLQPETKLEDFLSRAAGRRPGPRPIWRWAAAGAAAVLVVLCIWVLKTDRQGQTRLKGSLNVKVYVNRDGKADPAADGFRYRKGDRVRLGVSSPEAVRVTVRVRDRGGFVKVPELIGVPVPAGEELVLPGSLLLDCDGPSEAVRVGFVPVSGADKKAGELTIEFGCERP